MRLISVAASARLGALLVALGLSIAPVPAPAENGEAPPPPEGVGATVDTIVIKGVTYHGVRLRSIHGNGVVLQHPGGLFSATWRDLPPTWRPALEGLAPKERSAKPPQPSKTPAPTSTPNKLRQPSSIRLDSLFAGIGEPATVREGVDLRPRFRELGLWVKNQGPQPSCSVYAILSALEYQYAEAKGQPCRFDEQALIRSTEEVTQRRRLAGAESGEGDAGFTLPEVVMAIRKHGLFVSESFLQQELTRDPDSAMKAPVSPRVALHELPSRGDASQRIEDLIHVLNAGVPVPVGLKFPAKRAAQSGFLNTQPIDEGSAHAVTLVGYESESGRVEDTVFVFKNSWGVAWGAGGYGRVTYSYLLKHLVCAVVLEVD